MLSEFHKFSPNAPDSSIKALEINVEKLTKTYFHKSLAHGLCAPVIAITLGASLPLHRISRDFMQSFIVRSMFHKSRHGSYDTCLKMFSVFDSYWDER